MKLAIRFAATALGSTLLLADVNEYLYPCEHDVELATTYRYVLSCPTELRTLPLLTDRGTISFADSAGDVNGIIHSNFVLSTGGDFEAWGRSIESPLVECGYVPGHMPWGGADEKRELEDCLETCVNQVRSLHITGEIPVTDRFSSILDCEGPPVVDGEALDTAEAVTAVDAFALHCEAGFPLRRCEMRLVAAD